LNIKKKKNYKKMLQDEDFISFVEGCNKIIQKQIERDGYTEFGTTPLKIKQGDRFIKLYSNETSPWNVHDYYFAIVDKDTGDIYRPTGQGGLSKGARSHGNIYDVYNGLKYVTFTGVVNEQKLFTLPIEKRYPNNL
jgi:hypothetical protein